MFSCGRGRSGKSHEITRKYIQASKTKDKTISLGKSFPCQLPLHNYAIVFIHLPSSVYKISTEWLNPPQPPPHPHPMNTHNRHKQVYATGKPQIRTVPSLYDPWNRSGPLSYITVTVAPFSLRHGRSLRVANVTVSTYGG